MALVSYSDSEGSENDEATTQRITPNGASSRTTKPNFQKVIDRSNPHKIRVSLPQTKSTEQADERGNDEPPAKKARTATGDFSGFNSILPAPKRAVPATGGLKNGGARKGGLGSGVNLKTGAAPGFSREPMPDRAVELEPEDTNAEVRKKDPDINSGDLSMFNPLTDLPSSRIDTKALGEESKEAKKKGNAMMFKPLSVARKPQKKKPSTATTSVVQLSPCNGPKTHIKPTPKTALFSMESLDETPTSAAEAGEYQPLLYENLLSNAKESNFNPLVNFEPKDIDSPQNLADFQTPSTATTTTGDHDLDAIAADLNLSASARRQLLGRQRNNKKDSSNINVVNFNTDREYAANEILRQAGEQAQHNPVRAITSGKHSLKQLINAASNQKDALEEQFASGRRNKKEAGSRYGW